MDRSNYFQWELGDVRIVRISPNHKAKNKAHTWEATDEAGTVHHTGPTFGRVSALLNQAQDTLHDDDGCHT